MKSRNEIIENITYMAVFFILTMISFEDIKKMEISNWYNGFLFFIGIGKLFLNNNWEYRLITSLITMLILTICFFISKGGLGGGDVKLISASALIFGFQTACAALIIGAIGVTISGILCKIYYYFSECSTNTKEKHTDFRKMEFPLGPYFVIGIIMIFWKVI